MIICHILQVQYFAPLQLTLDVSLIPVLLSACGPKELFFSFFLFAVLE